MDTVKRFGPWLFLSTILVAACSGPQQTTGGGTTTTTTAQAEPTWVRFLHAIPDGPDFEFLIGNQTVGSGLRYSQWTDWVEVPSGEWDLHLRHGEGVTLSDRFNFEPHQRYWIFGYGALSPQGGELQASFLIAPEGRRQEAQDETWIRFGNVATEGEAYGLVITTGGSWTIFFPNQPMGTISEFQLGPILENEFAIIPSRDTTLDPVVTFEDTLQTNMLYTFVMVGSEDDNSLQVLTIAESAQR